MAEKYDFHCHSTASDGQLSPSQLIARAHTQGVTTLALTDHDTTAGLEEAAEAAADMGLNFINGIELSTAWQDKCFHIVGLGINPNFPALLSTTEKLQQVRIERAEKIADKLAKKQIPGAFAAVSKAAGTGMITRSHFADFLLSQFHVSSQQEAFDRYLGKGKPAYVSTEWVNLNFAVELITQSGGIAVLAHPLRYKLTASWLKRLLTDFKAAGGQGIEVVTGRHNPDEILQIADYAERFDLAGSVGSDFHSTSNQWLELGRLGELPKKIKPVWQLLSVNAEYQL